METNMNSNMIMSSDTNHLATLFNNMDSEIEAMSNLIKYIQPLIASEKENVPVSKADRELLNSLRK